MRNSSEQMFAKVDLTKCGQNTALTENILKNNKIDPSRLRAVGRLARGLYCRSTDILKLGDPRNQ